jgi:hypothetical protein
MMFSKMDLLNYLIIGILLLKEVHILEIDSPFLKVNMVPLYLIILKMILSHKVLNQ